MLKKLFYASASILMLALAYHLGASSAQGQVGTQLTGFATGGDACYPTCVVMTPNGDIYTRSFSCIGPPSVLRNVGNFWSGGPTPASQATWGQLKVQYRK